MSQNINDNFKIYAPKPLDEKYQKTISGGARPYNSLAEVNASIVTAYRSLGLTVLVDDGSGPKEYWYRHGITDGELIVKDDTPEVAANLASHANNTSNPHNVTKAQVGLGNVPNVNATLRDNHIGTQSADTIVDGTSNKAFTAAERAQLEENTGDIQSNATAFNDHKNNVANPHGVTKAQVGLASVPDVDATLRSNHTGTQSADTIVDGDANKAYTAAEKAQLASNTANIASNTADIGAKGSLTTLDKTSLVGAVNELKVAINTAATSNVVGVASPTTNPGTPVSNVGYNVSGAGTYTNFLSGPATPIVVSATDGFVVLRYSTATGYWTKVTSLLDLSNYSLKSYADENADRADVGLTGLKTGYVEFASRLTNGFYISATGIKTASTDYQCSDFIRVTTGQKIYYTGTLGGAAASIAGYSSASETAFVQVVFNLTTDGQSTASRKAYDEKLITIPSGVTYIRACSAFQNTSAASYVGGMRKLSLTDRLKASSILGSIDSNSEDLLKFTGVSTNVINLALPVYGTRYDSATNTFVTDSVRGHTGFQAVSGNRDYSIGKISNFLIMYDAGMNPIGYYQASAAIPFLDGLGIPRLSTGFSYNATTFTLSFRSPWNCAFVLGNNSTTPSLTTQALYDAWKASLSLATEVKSSKIKGSYTPQSVLDSIAANVTAINANSTAIYNTNGDILSLVGVSTNVVNNALSVYGQKYDSSVNAIVADSVRAHTGYQPVSGNRDYTFGNISNFLIMYDAAMNPIAYYQPTAVAYLDGLGIPRLTSGFTYNGTTFVLAFRTPVNCAFVLGNNNTAVPLTSQAAYDNWKAVLSLVTDVKGSTLKDAVLPQATKDATAKVTDIFKENTDVIDRNLFQYGKIYQTSIKDFQDTANRGTTGLQPVLPGQNYTISGISRFLVIFNSSMTIIGYYALSTDTTTINNMAGYTRYNLVDGVNYDTATNTLTFNSQAAGAFIAANNTGSLTSVGAYNAWRDAAKLVTKVAKPYIGREFLPTDLATGGGTAAINPITDFPAFLAHRGLHAASTTNVGGLIAPEDSLDAVKMAARLGFSIVETDVQATSDGRFVICHDDTMNRTYTNMDGSAIATTVDIASTTFAELRANYKLKSPFARFQQPIPSLEEYCALCSKLGLKAYIEPKPGMLTRSLAGLYLETIQRGMSLKNVVIHSFDVNALTYIRELNKDVPLVFIQEHLTTPTQASFDTCKTLGNCMLMCSETKVTTAVMDLATSNTTEVIVYTPAASRLNDLLSLGVRMFVADYMAPLESHKGTTVQSLTSDLDFVGFTPPSAPVNGIATLSANSMTSASQAISKLAAFWIEADIRGTCTVTAKIGSTTVTSLAVNQSGFDRVVLQSHSSNLTGNFAVTFNGTCDIKDVRIVVKQF